EALNSNDRGAAMEAIVALGQIGTLDAKVVPGLGGMLLGDNTYGTARFHAASAIAVLGRDAEDALPQLLASLKTTRFGGSEYTTPFRFALALGRIGKSAIPGLREALRGTSVGERETAACALGHIGPDAKDAVPDLILALSDPNERVRHEAAAALGKI